MAWFLCFLFWFLGAYAAGVAFASMFDTWGPTRMSIAIVIWPVIILVALSVMAVRATLQTLQRLKDGW